MRVHHIISDYSMFTGGAQRVVRDLHTGLRHRSINSHVFGIMQQKDPEMDAASSLGLESPYTMLAFHGIYRYITRNVRPNDIVHVHLFPPILYLSVISAVRQLRCHLICTEHSTSNRRRGTILGRVLDTITYSGYECVIAISKGVEQELLRWKPDLREKTRVIYNGVNLPFLQAMKHKAESRLKVVSVGNLRVAKNYDTALRAVALLRDFDFEYQIAGGGECKEDLQQLCQELNIESKVKFLGYIDTTPELLASAAIFLMPSRWEGFGLAAVEAMNASLPLVVSDVVGLREVVNNDSCCALLVDPESPESIAAGLKRLLVSSTLRSELGKNAFNRSQNFGVNQMVDNYMDLYGKLI